jgi:uncharacterized repeat protein (TIGR01451 family)
VQPAPILPLAITDDGYLPAGIAGTAYTHQLAATGGVDPYTWAVTSGALPAGLTLSASGVISGTPTLASTTPSAITLTLTDSQNPAASVSKDLLLFVNAPPPVPGVITTSSLPAATVGSPYAATLTVSGGTPPFRWSVFAGSTLPAGLTISSSGVISGTPTTAGTTSFTVQLNDSADPFYARPVWAPLSITVNPASNSGGGVPAPAGVDVAVSIAHVGSFVSGHTGTYRLKVTNTGTAAAKPPTTVTVTLPSGVSYQRATGSGWHCSATGQTVSCKTTSTIQRGHHTDALLYVHIGAVATTRLDTTAVVGLTDATPADNTAADAVTVSAPPRRR